MSKVPHLVGEGSACNKKKVDGGGINEFHAAGTRRCTNLNGFKVSFKFKLRRLSGEAERRALVSCRVAGHHSSTGARTCLFEG